MTAVLTDIVIRASAGTGKTYRLTNRFIQLLASGVAPETILAATFTRKAAGEILDRILRTMALAAKNDSDCCKLADAISTPELTRSRCGELLATLTQRLHRLQVSTLDSFFSRLASSYSLELGLPPGWRILDELESTRVKEDAIELLLESGSDDDLVRLLRLLTKGTTARGVTELLKETVSRCHEIALDTTQEAWRRVPCPPLPTANELRRSQQLLRELADMTEDKRLRTAFTQDAEQADREQWDEMLKGGILAKLVQGETTYYRKELDAETKLVYETLLSQITALVMHRLSKQTEATRELIDQFDRELRELQRRQGGIGFSDVARALAQSRDRSQKPKTKANDVAEEKSLTQLGFRLDARLSHLLLDEFQDTSPLQWQVLRPFAEQMLSKQRRANRPAQLDLFGDAQVGIALPGNPQFGNSELPPSFFCVGDTKQAIYGWRGGDARIFQLLKKQLPTLAEETLAQSYRSAPAIIDTVNRVFTRLASHPRLEKLEQPMLSWCEEFPMHSTAKVDLPGYAQLRVANAAADGEKQNDATLKEAAALVAELTRTAPGRTIGVLTRTNDAVGQLMFELQTLNVPASEEGGNLLIDSAAVRLILSLLHLADHPGDTVSRFHVATSPLGTSLELLDFRDELAATKLAARVRRQLLTEGYGPSVALWASKLAPTCNVREASRLEQLIDAAFGYQASATLRPRDFIEQVRAVRIADPSTDLVRVMTVHQAKGLEFDIVVLPQLDEDIPGQTPTIVAGGSAPAEPPDAVCLYCNANIQQQLPPKLRQLFEQDLERRTHESLCVLYVALTRAIHSLHMLIGPTNKPPAKTFAGLLRASLTENAEAVPNKTLFETGDPNWFERASALHKQPSSQSAKPTEQVSERVAIRSLANSVRDSFPKPKRISFAVPLPVPERGWQREAPSRKQESTSRKLADFFQSPATTARERGTLFHKWFEQIEWLEDGLPSVEKLLGIVQPLGLRTVRPAEVVSDFLRMLELPAVESVLRRGQPPHKNSAPRLFREYPFACRFAEKLMTGTIDRLVVWQNGNRNESAELLDFKTDVIPANGAALEARTAEYRSQLELYRQAVSQLFGIDLARVTARLVFVQIGQVVTL